MRNRWENEDTTLHTSPKQDSYSSFSSIVYASRINRLSGLAIIWLCSTRLVFRTALNTSISISETKRCSQHLAGIQKDLQPRREACARSPWSASNAFLFQTPRMHLSTVSGTLQLLIFHNSTYQISQHSQLKREGSILRDIAVYLAVNGTPDPSHGGRKSHPSFLLTPEDRERQILA